MQQGMASINFYNNADQLINDSESHAVYIATPPDSHKMYALKIAANAEKQLLHRKTYGTKL